MNKSTYIIIVSFLIFPLPLIAEVNALGNICNNVIFTKCITVNRNKCMTAKTSSEATCLKKPPFNLDAEREEEFKNAKNYGLCFTDNFIENLGTNINKFNKCVISSNHLKHIEEYIKNKHNEK